MSLIDTQATGLFTSRYAKYKNPLPASDSFQNFLRFVESSDRSGKELRYPLLTAFDQGVTVDQTGTSFAINAARPGNHNEAILDGVDVMIRSQFAYSAQLKAAAGTSSEGDKAAYLSPVDFAVFSMLKGLQHHNEMLGLYGPGNGATIGGDVGIVATVPVAPGSGATYGAGTHPIVQITHGSWARQMWVNSGSGGQATSGLLVDILNAAGTATVETGVQVEGVVDGSKCQVQMFKSGSAVAVTAGTRIVPAGYYQKACLGVQGICQNAGTFANINAAVIPQWRAATFDLAGAALTYDKIISFCSILSNNGGNKGLTAWVNPNTFAAIVNSTVGLQQWTNGAGGDTKDIGTDAVSIRTPAGPVKLKSYGYIKQGLALLLDPSECVRIGASEATQMGGNGQSIYLDLPNNAGAEMRAMCQWAPLLTMPYRSALVTGIANPNDDKSTGDTTL